MSGSSTFYWSPARIITNSQYLNQGPRPHTGTPLGSKTSGSNKQSGRKKKLVKQFLEESSAISSIQKHFGIFNQKHFGILLTYIPICIPCIFDTWCILHISSTQNTELKQHKLQYFSSILSVFYVKTLQIHYEFLPEENKKMS